MTGSDDAEWSRQQEKLTRASAALSGAGAVTLAGLLAGKTKAARKVLPKKAHRVIAGSTGDDIRSGVALASMLTGTASGVHWANKLREDADATEAVKSARADRARNLAAAMSTRSDYELGKSMQSSTVMRTLRGLRPRRAYYRRPPLRRARIGL